MHDDLYFDHDVVYDAKLLYDSMTSVRRLFYCGDIDE